MSSLYHFLGRMGRCGSGEAFLFFTPCMLGGDTIFSAHAVTHMAVFFTLSPNNFSLCHILPFRII